MRVWAAPNSVILDQNENCWLLQHLAVAGPACMKSEILRFGEPNRLFPSPTLAH